MSRARRVAIVQSSYIPWKGYFDLINVADEFILLDDAQYTRRDWRNRNRIKTSDGVRWLTIPVMAKGGYHQRVEEVRIATSRWRERHWRGISQAYARAPCFEHYRDRIGSLYLDRADERLSDVNRCFLEAICRELGITTPFSWSSDHGVPPGDPSERLAALVAAVGGTEYVSGPSARSYLRLEPFEERAIEVSYFDYGEYPEHRQCHGPFEHHVSALDLLFNTGAEARRYMKSFDGSPPLVPAAR
ncbi:MAG: hypothetical protein QOJ21_18 [Solirubrobacteraceae bacterium]|jgi:hypothetical protein|nr:hypothetical protein [Solirubrobacteraceae bacterium]